MSSISATPLLVVRIKAEHARYRTTIEALTTQVFELAEVERREEADLDVLEARQEEASRTLASVKGECCTISSIAQTHIRENTARLEVMKITIEERDKENKERREALLRNNARKRGKHL